MPASRDPGMHTLSSQPLARWTHTSASAAALFRAKWSLDRIFLAAPNLTGEQ